MATLVFQAVRRLPPQGLGNLLSIMLPISFGGWAWLCFPWHLAYELNADEGINLAKGALVSAGYALYQDVWSDQPPLFSHALALVQYLQPWSVTAARLLVLVSACVMLWSLSTVVRRRHGWQAATWATLLLGSAPLFIQLSVSVMVGLPALALALAAMAVLPADGRLHPARLVLAGVLMALSMQTKFFTVLLVPSMLAMLWRASPGRDSCRAAVWFLSSLALITSLLLAWAGKAFVEQLLHPHFSATLRDAFSLPENARTIWQVLRRQPLLWVSGLIGGAALFRHLGQELLPPAGWFVLVLLALLSHTPVWPHHVLLLMPALAWVGGVALTRAVTRLRGASLRWGQGMAAALAMSVVGLSLTIAMYKPRLDKADLTKRSAGAVAERFAGLGGWMVTDAPMDAFRAGLLVPPELAVYTWKRVKVGELTAQDVLDAIHHRQPRQVAFRRFSMDPDVLAFLDRHYLLTHQGDGFRHYVAVPTSTDLPAAEKASALLTDLVDRFALTSVRGGYAGVVRPGSPPARYGETLHYPIGAGAVYMRPPGSTPRIGACYLRAFQLTGLVRQREFARDAARAVVRSQRCDGAWLPAAGEQGACPGGLVSGGQQLTFDEGMMAEAIFFLLEVRAASSGDAAWLDPAIHKALDFLLSTQDAQGGWPYALSGSTYARYSTINDDLTTSHIRALLAAHAVFPRADVLAASRRGIDFLLRSQSPQGGWAQQYDAQLHIVGARSFEPAALSSLETAYVIRTLVEADQHLRDPRLMPAVRRAVAWLGRVALAQDWWARFYALDTSQPLYLDRQGRIHRSMASLPEERRLGYRWEESFPEVTEAIAVAEAWLSGQDERQRLGAVERLTQAGAALAQLRPELDSGHADLNDARGLIWSRSFLDQCRMVRALVSVRQGQALTDSNELQHR